MNDVAKIGVSHLARAAYVYLRQSSPAQVEHNRESTQRQYALVSKATALGWPSQQIVVIDEDLGVSGSGIVERNGFARLTAEVALRQIHDHPQVRGIGYDEQRVRRVRSGFRAGIDRALRDDDLRREVRDAMVEFAGWASSPTRMRNPCPAAS